MEDRNTVLVERIKKHDVRIVANSIGRAPSTVSGWKRGFSKIPWYMQDVVEEALNRLEAGLPGYKLVGEKNDGSIDQAVVDRVDAKLK